MMRLVSLIGAALAAPFALLGGTQVNGKMGEIPPMPVHSKRSITGGPRSKKVNKAGTKRIMRYYSIHHGHKASSAEVALQWWKNYNPVPK